MRSVWKSFMVYSIPWCLLIFLLSNKPIRGWVAAPLFVCDQGQNLDSELAYVMADGHSYWERLHGASDLYHMGHIKKIYLRDEKIMWQYDFVKQKSDFLVDRAIEYLVWNGVPADAIDTIPIHPTARLGSLGEAEMLAQTLPNVQSITVVTSAPHTRRARLCFERTLPNTAKISIYSPSPPQDSSEINEPLWAEYLKLIIYYVVA